jgi:CDP-paratose 2-epimerase
MKYFITGGAGFLGTNIAKTLLNRGFKVVVFDSLFREGCAQNLQWLKSAGNIEFIHGDIRNPNDVKRAVADHHPEIIFHLAGQVAMTRSVGNPRMDFEVNALGSLNVLESARLFSPESHIFLASTNKVYGSLEKLAFVEEDSRYILPGYPHGLNETTPLEFNSPYGCSKGSADQYFLDYYRTFGVKTTVFRHSTIYGGRQFATYDQGWIGWFCLKAIEAEQGRGKTFTISGNGKQVRDILHVDDCVACYLAAAEQSERTAGKVFNIGGGPENSFSLLELFVLLEKELTVRLSFSPIEWRLGDQKVFIADYRQATSCFGWAPRIGGVEGVRDVIVWTRQRMRENGKLK